MEGNFADSERNFSSQEDRRSTGSPRLCFVSDVSKSTLYGLNNLDLALNKEEANKSRPSEV